MMLTGLVKLISHARGASRATMRPYSTIGRDGAHRHGKAGRADGLLADDIERDRGGFISSRAARRRRRGCW